MIRDIEIRQIAREYGVPESTFEKDYALSWILHAMSHHTDSMAFKGGTGIRKMGTVPKSSYFSDTDLHGFTQI